MKLIILCVTFIVLLEQPTYVTSSEYRKDHHDHYYVPKPTDEIPPAARKLLLSLHNLREKVEKCCDKIAFSAARKVSKCFKTGDKVPFETVWLNIGSGYNKDTGVFQVKKAGLYSFSATIMSYHCKKTAWCVLVVNNAHHSKIYGSLNYAAGAVTAAIQLSPGDEVFIEMLRNGGIYGGHWSSFSGHLI